MIQLAQNKDGRLIIASNQKFPSEVRRVEYYRDMKLFILVYENEDHGSDLMPCEISEETAVKVIRSPDIIVIAMAEKGREPYGYQVPLVQIGL
ncbi:MAG: hypothetical protein GW903_05265 [Alphaproteobacteria bacterium]|nr:hypothetical protein [Alphaproteobacteria bacterium]NCQ89001.1 hypothetical protein [Alphaproteobacteria bacterium]NCT07902.1 hypothetical protein [Alphaproteobacteria bacterium]